MRFQSKKKTSTPANLVNGNQYATPDITEFGRQTKLLRQTQAMQNAELIWIDIANQLEQIEHAIDEQIKRKAEERQVAIKEKQKEKEARLLKIETDNGVARETINNICKKNQDDVLRLIGIEAKLQKEEEARRKEQERLLKEQERLKKEQELLEQKLLVEKKLALEREKAEKEKKEREMAQAASRPVTNAPKTSPNTAARPSERKTLPPIPVDNYFHQDWITIIQATLAPGTQWVSLEAWMEFLQYHDHFKSTFRIFSSIKNSNDPQVRKQFVDFQGKIQSAFTALTTRQRQVDWKITLLTDELNARSNNQLAYVVAAHLIVDRYVFQGVSYVQKNLTAAYSFGYVAVGVMLKHPTIFNYLVAQLHESCPYCVPMIPPRQQGQSKDDYQFKILKYKKTLDENGKEVLENMASFTKRVCGFISLMTTLYCIQVGDGFPRIHKAWDWLVRFLQLKIRPYSAFLLHSFLQSANYYLLLYYKNQYLKLRQFIIHDWWNRLDPKDETGVNQMGMGVLKTFLEEAHTNYLNGENKMPESATLDGEDDD